MQKSNVIHAIAINFTRHMLLNQHTLVYGDWPITSTLDSVYKNLTDQTPWTSEFYLVRHEYLEIKISGKGHSRIILCPFFFTLCIKAFQLSSSIRQELDLLLMYSTISPIKKDINVPIETNKLSLSPNDSMKIENVNVKLLYI